MRIQIFNNRERGILNNCAFIDFVKISSGLSILKLGDYIIEFITYRADNVIKNIEVYKNNKKLK